MSFVKNVVDSFKFITSGSLKIKQSCGIKLNFSNHYKSFNTLVFIIVGSILKEFLYTDIIIKKPKLIFNLPNSILSLRNMRLLYFIIKNICVSKIINDLTDLCQFVFKSILHLRYIFKNIFGKLNSGKFHNFHFHYIVKEIVSYI